MAGQTLTARAIASLKAPPSGQRDLWDRGLPGFGMRVSYGGRKAWVLRYRVKGRLRRMTIGVYPHLTLAKARKAARNYLHAVSLGQDPAADKAGDRQAETFAELAAEYLERHAKPKKRSWQADERIINTELLPSWRSLKVRDIKRRDVRRLLEEIAERPAPVMANRVLALVRKMFNFALERDWIEVNPATKLPRPGDEHSRQRVLTDDEIRTLWAELEKEPLLYRAFGQLRLLTAQRGGELRQMRWADVELEDGWWTIPPEFAKNGLAHRVPLSPSAVDILKTLLPVTGSSVWVFPSPVRRKNPPKKGRERPLFEVKAIMRRVCAENRADLDIRGHDLRRTAASRMAAAGVSRLVISKVLNHVERGVTAVYDRHGYDQEKRAALNLWGALLKSILEKQPEEKPAASVLAFSRG